MGSTTEHWRPHCDWFQHGKPGDECTVVPREQKWPPQGPAAALWPLEAITLRAELQRLATAILRACYRRFGLLRAMLNGHSGPKQRDSSTKAGQQSTVAHVNAHTAHRPVPAVIGSSLRLPGAGWSRVRLPETKQERLINCVASISDQQEASCVDCCRYQ